MDHDYPHGKFVSALSQHGSYIYSIDNGVWYVSVNQGTGHCQITSGDIWYDISREEAFAWLNHGNSKAPAAAA